MLKFSIVGRIIAIDYGKKRTGIAVTDALQIIASGLTTVATDELKSFLLDYVEKEEVDLILIGKPKQLDNTPSESESLIATFVEELEKLLPNIPLKRIDERFTSKIAMQTMLEGGLKRKQRRNKALVDEISATIILQSYLYNK